MNTLYKWYKQDSVCRFAVIIFCGNQVCLYFSVETKCIFSPNYDNQVATVISHSVSVAVIV
jgi:hypothetical protein